jgi:hypothetical protein
MRENSIVAMTYAASIVSVCKVLITKELGILLDLSHLTLPLSRRILINAKREMLVLASFWSKLSSILPSLAVLAETGLTR